MRNLSTERELLLGMVSSMLPANIITGENSDLLVIYAPNGTLHFHLSKEESEALSAIPEMKLDSEDEELADDGHEEPENVRRLREFTYKKVYSKILERMIVKFLSERFGSLGGVLIGIGREE